MEAEAESALTAAAMESTEIADEEVYDSLKAIAEFRLKRRLYRHRGGNLDPNLGCYGPHPKMRFLHETSVFLLRFFNFVAYCKFISFKESLRKTGGKLRSLQHSSAGLFLLHWESPESTFSQVLQELVGQNHRRAGQALQIYE